MGTPEIVEGEWDDQPRNWRTFFRRWRRSRERLEFEVVRTEAMSAEAFFVIGRVVCGQVGVGDALVVEAGDEKVTTLCLSIDHTVQNDDEFHVYTALQLEGIGSDSGIEPGTVIRSV